jgi:SAM-dependent methyltransferase
MDQTKSSLKIQHTAAISDYCIKWLKGIPHEMNFWSEWFNTKGLEWPDEYARRLASSPKFTLGEFISSYPKGEIEVLDVGSGPISPIGIENSEYRIVLVACDPLAEQYSKLFDNHKIEPYVKPIFAYAESLTDVFESESFDIVHMSNALDHSFSPYDCILNMLEVVRVGGKIILRHAENEAIHENYQGFHQWNITESDGDFIFFNSECQMNLSHLIKEFADVSCSRLNEGSRDIIQATIVRKYNGRIRKANFFKASFDSALLQMLAGHQ